MSMISGNSIGSVFSSTILAKGFKSNYTPKEAETGLAERSLSADSLLQDEYLPSLRVESGKSSDAVSIAWTVETPEAAEDTDEVTVQDQTEGRLQQQKRTTVDMSSFVRTQRENAPNGSVAGMMEDLGLQLEQQMLQGIISQVLKSKGVELSKGDVLAFRLNGAGEIGIDAKMSKVNGYDDEELAGICSEVAYDLNRKEVDGVSFGDALLKHFSKTMDFDYDTVKGDESFQIAFSFRVNPETGVQEIMNARIGRELDQNSQSFKEMMKAREEAGEGDKKDTGEPIDLIFYGSANQS